MEQSLTIATCQHAMSTDIRKNLTVILDQIRKAAAGKADIVHFSECNLSGYAGHQFNSVQEQDNPVLQESIEKVMKLAGELHIAVILGSHHFEKDLALPYNSLYLINRKGVIEDRYDKRFLTGPMGKEETRHYSPGHRPVLFRIKGMKCGLLICHEWRYPELYRQYSRMEARVIFQSFYDGNLSLEAFRHEGKELGELITGAVRGYAANNHLWISASNTSTRESSYPAFVAQPDGKIFQRLPRNRAGIIFTQITPVMEFADPSSHNRDRVITSFYGDQTE
jgi:predicted amidohydrolase